VTEIAIPGRNAVEIPLKTSEADSASGTFGCTESVESRVREM
jgi:hypothetical protein